MANKVRYGLRNVVYSKITITDGVYSYGTPVAMPGAVNLSMSAKGDSTDLFADDSIYFTVTANQGYEGDLELALLTEDFYKDIMGETEDGNGALVENADAIQNAFALGYEVQGDSTGTRTWLYHCTATRPNSEAATKEASITPGTDKLTLKAIPRTSDKNVKVKMVKTVDNEAEYEAFFSAVYEETTPSA